MTYDESFALSSDLAFGGRVQVAVLKYSAYILDEAPTTASHNTRFKWAVGATEDPNGTARKLQPSVVMDAAVQSAGAAISDSALQSAVENVVNKLM